MESPNIWKWDILYTHAIEINPIVFLLGKENIFRIYAKKKYSG